MGSKSRKPPYPASHAAFVSLVAKLGATRERISLTAAQSLSLFVERRVIGTKIKAKVRRALSRFLSADHDGCLSAGHRLIDSVPKPRQVKK